MKPSDLYKLMPEDSHHNVDILSGCHYNHIPDVDLDDVDIDQVEKDQRVLIKVYKEHTYDYRRFWRLASVWFDNEPIMIVQNAGREGDDYTNRFITNTKQYYELVSYLRTLLLDEYKEKEYDPNEDISNLTRFYNDSFDIEEDIKEDVEVPKTLNEALSMLSQFSNGEDDFEKIINQTEKSFSATLHFGLGMWMRNNWELWEQEEDNKGPLCTYFNDLGIFHADDMSGIILTTFYRRYHDIDEDISGQIKHYKDYWKKNTPIINNTS